MCHKVKETTTPTLLCLLLYTYRHICVFKIAHLVVGFCGCSGQWCKPVLHRVLNLGNNSYDISISKGSKAALSITFHLFDYKAKMQPLSYSFFPSWYERLKQFLCQCVHSRLPTCSVALLVLHLISLKKVMEKRIWCIYFICNTS